MENKCNRPARCGDYTKLFSSHPILVKEIVINGFELTLEDLHYAIDNCYVEMITYLLDELGKTLSAEDLTDVKRRITSTDNDRILSHRQAILSSIDTEIASKSLRAEPRPDSPRPSTAELHAASAVEEAIMLSRTGGSAADDLDTGDTEREVVLDKARP